VRVGVMKHHTTRTALKYGAPSCGEEYTPGNGGLEMIMWVLTE